MTGPEHYREAERLLIELRRDGAEYSDEANAVVAGMAQAHATLALAAATRAGNGRR